MKLLLYQERFFYRDIMASQKIPLFIYAGSILKAARPDRPSPPCRKIRRMVEDYIYARRRVSSYYVLSLDSIRDINVCTPNDIDKFERFNLRKLERDETINCFNQTYYPTAWILRKGKWVPFEFVNLALWEAVSWDTRALKVVAEGLLVGIKELIENTPLEKTLVVRRAAIGDYPEGPELGAFPVAKKRNSKHRRTRRRHPDPCAVM